MSKVSEFSNKKQVRISLTFKLSMLYNAHESRFHVKGYANRNYEM